MDTIQATSNGTQSHVTTGNKPTKDSKQRRHLPSLPSATSATEMTPVIYNGLSDKTPVEWNFLKNYEVFSLSPDGSFPMMKVSRSKAVRLSDREVLMVGGGRCYRVSLSNHYTPTPWVKIWPPIKKRSRAVAVDAIALSKCKNQKLSNRNGENWVSTPN